TSVSEPKVLMPKVLPLRSPMPTPAFVNMVIGMVLQVEVTSRRSAPCLLARTAGASPTCMPWISPESSTCRPRVPPSILMTSTLSPSSSQKPPAPPTQTGKMVTTGAEMPILNGIGSAARAHVAAAPSANANSETAAMPNLPNRIASSRSLPPVIVARIHHALETAIALVNVAPVAVGLHVLLDQAPDAIFDCVETRLAFHRQPARALDSYWDRLFDLSRPAGKDHDTVR